MQLHKVPAGLLDLLRLRTLGRAPDQFSDSVLATVESSNFYGADVMVVASDSGGAGAVSRSVTGTAARPGRLFAMSGQITIGAAAGTALRLLLSFSPGPQFSSVIVAQEVWTPVAAGVFCVSIVFPSPIVFLAGASFTFTTAGDAGGADHTPVRRELFENLTA